MPRKGKTRLANMSETELSTRLFIGNLDFETTAADLDALLFPHGGFGARVIIDRGSGISRGFGFADCDADRAAGAVAALHESDFMGRKIRVARATPRATR